ncbi:MAG TPA: amidohydrolase family protein [Ideonella sp.]|uniref:amidohydrolase family protein n=1 Tax=Ideonella sp. TaxID=1929293 RepID=UPI002E34AA2B|nr:amidohydrolase family protein [Ideonella sp.]HEX5686857.1 amidohydrolase family protein [Ideonella sp.]
MHAWLKQTIRVLASAWLCAASMPAIADELAIVGARLYTAPDAAAIERGTVLVRDGRIAAVGPTADIAVPRGAAVVDAQGAVLTAGFWNSHVHLLPPPLRDARRATAPELDAALQAMLTRWGFTAVFDIGSLPGGARALRRRIDTGEVAGPMILTTDALFFPEGGTPIYVRELFQQLNVPSMEVASAAQAQSRARLQLADGADGVKMMAGAIVGGPVGVLPMDRTIAAALVDEAHRQHKPAFAHPTTLQGLDISITSGVDVLAHPTPTEGPWSPELVKRLTDRRMALTPTLTLIEIELKNDSAPPDVVQRFVAAGQQQVGAFARAGGQVLFGTDVGYIEWFDTRREYELMAGAGLDWRAILASLTTAPAERFGHAARKGRIAVGMDADLVLLRRDPATDPAAFADVKTTWRAGRVIYDARAR